MKILHVFQETVQSNEANELMLYTHAKIKLGADVDLSCNQVFLLW